MNWIRQSFFLVAVLSLLIATTDLHAQERDLRAERLVLDDSGTDSTTNTITIRTASTLLQNVVLMIPDPGTGTAEFMLTSGSGGSDSWLLGGNGGTTSGTDFLGTTDSAALQLQVRGGSGTIANSLILNRNGSLQRDTAGYARGAGAVDIQISRSVATLVAAGAHSVIGGGQNNGIASTADNATISGGMTNTIRAGAIYSTIGGGTLNTIDTSARYAVIGGGRENTIGTGDDYSTIGGGYQNLIEPSTTYGTIGGGRLNKLRSGADYSTIGGGAFNRIELGSHHGTIGGGEDNAIYDSATYSTIGGGTSNRIRYRVDYATVGGGFRNYIDADADYSTIGGGEFNEIKDFATNSMIGGGRNNTIGDSADYATIGGGRANGIRPHGDYSTIGGGWGNIIDGQSSVIPGGTGLTLNADRSFGFLANNGSRSMTIAESDVAVFGNTNLWLANNTGTASHIRFYEANSTTGSFPSTDFYVSFEASSLSTTIEYILPAAKPTLVGQVLKVSAINGNAITLAWGTDNTIAGRDGSDIPSAIGGPDDGSDLKSRMKRLAGQLEAGEQSREAQVERLQALSTEMQGLERQGAVLTSEEDESKENTSTHNAE